MGCGIWEEWGVAYGKNGAKNGRESLYLRGRRGKTCRCRASGQNSAIGSRHHRESLGCHRPGGWGWAGVGWGLGGGWGRQRKECAKASYPERDESRRFESNLRLILSPHSTRSLVATSLSLSACLRVDSLSHAHPSFCTPSLHTLSAHSLCTPSLHTLSSHTHTHAPGSKSAWSNSPCRYSSLLEQPHPSHRRRDCYLAGA